MLNFQTQKIAKHTVAFFFFLCFWATSSAAQKLDFERLSSELGLSQNMIICLFQDSQGFLWVGTKDGLNRFDGYRFTTFRYDPFDSLSISGNYIYSILEDRNGHFWVATDKGINLFDREKEIFYALKTQGSGMRFVEDSAGNIWQGGNHEGLLRLRLPPGKSGAENVEIEFIKPAYSLDNILSTPVWDTEWHGIVGCEGGLPLRLRRELDGSGRQKFRFDQNFEDLKNAPADAAPLLDFFNRPYLDPFFYNQFEPGRAGKIWMSEGKNLFGWDTHTGKTIEIPIPPEHRKGEKKGVARLAEIGALLEDRRGRVWLGRSGATFRADISRGDVQQIACTNSDISNPLLNGTASLYEDLGGLVWLGTCGNGLLKFNDNARRFGPGLRKMPSIRAIFKTSDGRVWLSQMTSGLYFMDPLTQQPVLAHKNLLFFKNDFGNALCFHEDKNGALWVGGHISGLFKITDWQSGRQPKFEQIPIETKLEWNSNYCPSKIIEDPSGMFWMVSPDALRRFDPRSKAVEKFPFFDENDLGAQNRNQFPTVFQDHRGRIWIGMGGSGLWLFDVEKKSFQKFQSDRRNPQSLSQDVVKSIAEDPTAPDRFLFIGTGGGGLNHFDTETGVFEKFTEKDGLPDMVVYGILPDEQGNLWLSTNKGLSVFNPKTRVFRNFDQHDGLQNLEFNTLAYSKSADGELFFGGIEGYNSFYPSKMVQANQHVPPIVFTDFKIAGKSVSHKTEGSALDVTIAYAKKIVLQPDVKVFSFEFAALDFADPAKNQFARKMDGFDPVWVPLGTAHSATYTNLKPGKYTFRVRGSNNDGIWNEDGASIEIEILAPWWATWWAYLGYFLAVGTVVFTFYQLQINRNQAKAEVLRQQELNEAKSQFLSTVSHELRTPMTSILGFSKIIQKRLEERILPKTDRSDPKTERAVGQVMDNLKIVVSESERLTALINEVLDLAKIEAGKVIWQEEKLQIGELIERATAATSNLFENKNLQIRREIEPNLPEITGDSDRLLQVLVNLLSNAVKFTEYGSVTVSAKLQNEKAILVGVADTGIGIPEEFHGAVFEKFQQVTSDRLTDKPQGTGLGLPICKEIVEHHGGRIWVESRAGAGSIFWFTLTVR